VKVKSATPSRYAIGALCVAALLGSGCRGRGRDEAAAGFSPRHPEKASSSSSIFPPFVSLSFDEALLRARTEKKLVFVDLTASWCGWCTKMDEDVFPDARVKEALGAFVPIRVDTDTAGGRALANQHGVRGLPAFLVVDADGALVGRFDGYLPATSFLARLARVSKRSG
jgi:thiol:disulfide interchange protein